MKHPRECINPHYRLSRELRVMRKMHVHHNRPEEGIEWVERWATKERTFTCGNCPSYNLCKFTNRYGIGGKRDGTM